MLNLRIYPDPILRQQCLPVEDIKSPRVKNLAIEMDKLMRFFNGIGLAAPQVGIQERIIVVGLPEKSVQIINPEIVKNEGECFFEEGCLSVPGADVNIKRPECIAVTGYDPDGNKIRFEARELFARVIQHEVDHLNGKLIIDKMSPGERIRFNMEYNRNS
jgi:peptide deformylase